MTISPEAKEAATNIVETAQSSIGTSCFIEEYVPVQIQLAINSATAPLQKEIDKWKASHDNQVKLRRMLMDRPDLKERAKLVSGLTEENQKLQKEIERLRGEVEKAWREGFKDGQFGFVPSIVTEVRRDYVWQESHAKRVAEGKE
jgi:hypothetical protein